MRSQIFPFTTLCRSATVGRVAPRQAGDQIVAGTAVGLAGGLGSLGGFIIPWLTGRLANDESLAAALTSLSLWLILLVVAAAIVRKRLSAHATPPSQPTGTPVTG